MSAHRLHTAMGVTTTRSPFCGEQLNRVADAVSRVKHQQSMGTQMGYRIREVYDVGSRGCAIPSTV